MALEESASASPFQSVSGVFQKRAAAVPSLCYPRIVDKAVAADESMCPDSIYANQNNDPNWK